MQAGKVDKRNSSYEMMYWWSLAENDQHCFKENPANKEILTVNADYPGVALDMFHERLTKGDYYIERYSGGSMYMKKTFLEGSMYQLEMASCIFRYDGWFFRNDTRYISYRLKD